MNDRIKELLVAAGEYEMDINDPEFVVPDTLKKFAELIVRECANVADGGWAAPGIQIKQHFGVEE